MKKIIIIILCFVLFAGCTQQPTIDNKDNPNKTNETKVSLNETINNNNENISNNEYTKKYEEINSSKIECYYEDENEKILTKSLEENLRIHYVTQYENTEMIFKANENTWYIKSDNKQFNLLTKEEGCVWLMWNFTKINEILNKSQEETSLASSLLDFQQPQSENMYCKEGNFGLEIFSPSDKICDMTDLIIQMYTINQ